MAQVKLALSEMSDAEFLEFVKAHIQKMNGNPNFPTPRPTPAELQAKATTFENDLTAHYAILAAGVQSTATKNGSRGDLDAGMTTRGNYVNETSGGNEAIILSSGLHIRAPKTPLGIPAAPDHLVASMGDLAGTIDVMWDPTRGGKSFMVQVCTDPIAEANWKQAGIALKSSFTVTGLTSGTKYWFRVAAIGTAGQGPWSDPATKMAP